MAYFVVGLAAAILVGAAGWFLLRSPAVLGLAPDGAPTDSAVPVAGGQGPASATDCTVREAARMPEFAWLYVSSALICLPIFIVFAHIVPYARDAVARSRPASRALGAVGIGSAIGRLMLGPLADCFVRRRSYALTMVLVTILMLAWLGLPAAPSWPPSRRSSSSGSAIRRGSRPGGRPPAGP